MDLLDVLSDFNVKKNSYYGYEAETSIGVMQIGLNGSNRLCTNFIGNEAKARLALGHWKNNTFVDSKEDVKDFIKGLFRRIENYKLALREGDFNYKK